MAIRTSCSCCQPSGGKKFSSEVVLHNDIQDIKCDAWKRLLELVEIAAAEEQEEFAPRREMEPDDWKHIITLPSSISKLKSVKHLLIYGSNLVRMPPEIGEMTNLETFTPYTSHRLHWFPYEITRCKKLKDSTVSTRALYGNYKFRSPFPRLPVGKGVEAGAPSRCSICNLSIDESSLRQVWISLPVATDVLPLLVNACSQKCIDELPCPPKNYVQKSHQGGLNLQQPAKNSI
jgi:hypothetical protein